jgi:hypothetical protein
MAGRRSGRGDFQTFAPPLPGAQAHCDVLTECRNLVCPLDSVWARFRLPLSPSGLAPGTHPGPFFIYLSPRTRR